MKYRKSKKISRRHVRENHTPPFSSKGDFKSIVLYNSPDGRVAMDVRLEQDTLWLSLDQMAKLFDRDKSVISRHLHNIFASSELKAGSVVANYATTAADGKTYQVDYYNLDAIISVGYRVNSKRGTQFRIWATGVLRDHILKGYTINEKRLKEQNARLLEMERAVKLLGRVIEDRKLAHDEADGLLRVITDYARALSLLDQYDHHKLKVGPTTRRAPFMMTYDAARAAIDRMTEQMRREGHSLGLFGREKDDSFKSAVATIYQTFGSRELYPSVEEKAAHLLYFVVKNHGFVDGNKRIGAALFVWFLHANDLLYLPDGRRRLADNALVALTLLTAESRPADKDIIIKVIVNLINNENRL
jgi:prophage maintenance system killer protein